MSGKRQAASPPADEPDAKQAKGDDADAKAGADAENAGAEAGGDDPMETEENGQPSHEKPRAQGRDPQRGKGRQGERHGCARVLVNPSTPTVFSLSLGCCSAGRK